MKGKTGIQIQYCQNDTAEMTTTKKRKREYWIWGVSLLLLWGLIAFFFYRTHGQLGVSDLLRYQPENLLLAALAMCGLFLLKSVDFLMQSVILYALSGIMFPLPAALAINIVGIAILSIVPYCIGRKLGTPILERVYEKHPKFRHAENLNKKSEFVLVLLMRCVGFPITETGLYMGAKGYDFKVYLLGSELGLIPIMIPFTVMGDTAADFRSPVFLSAAAVELAIVLLAFWYYRRLHKNNKQQVGEMQETEC